MACRRSGMEQPVGAHESPIGRVRDVDVCRGKLSDAAGGRRCIRVMTKHMRWDPVGAMMRLVADVTRGGDCRGPRPVLSLAETMHEVASHSRVHECLCREHVSPVEVLAAFGLLLCMRRYTRAGARMTSAGARVGTRFAAVARGRSAHGPRPRRHARSVRGWRVKI